MIAQAEGLGSRHRIRAALKGRDTLPCRETCVALTGLGEIIWPLPRLRSPRRPCPCMFFSCERGILEKVGEEVFRGGCAAPAKKNRTRRPAVDRLALGAIDAVAQRDRGRPGIVSPNSRQS